MKSSIISDDLSVKNAIQQSGIVWVEGLKTAIITFTTHLLIFIIAIAITVTITEITGLLAFMEDTTLYYVQEYIS